MYQYSLVQSSLKHISALIVHVHMYKVLSSSLDVYLIAKGSLIRTASMGKMRLKSKKLEQLQKVKEIPT